MLEDMLKLPNQVPVYIILDMVDECSNTDQKIQCSCKRVLDLLKRLVNLELSNLHLCVMSQPVDDIQVISKFKVGKFHLKDYCHSKPFETSSNTLNTLNDRSI
jgi:hypothetical protein